MVKKTNAGSAQRRGTARLPLLVVLMLTGAAAVYAQKSPTSEATGGRFTTDVDNFISTTDWAGVPVTNWFSYLNIGNSKGGLDGDTPWEIGFAKKLSSLYIALSYSGKWWSGRSGFGTITDNMNGTYSGPSVNVNLETGIAAFSTSVSGGISAADKNVVSMLFGFASGGALKLKLTEDNAFRRKEGAIIVERTDNPGIQTIGFARILDGKLTPSVEWGFANPVEFGKFSIKPKATLDLKIGFDEQEVQVDGETLWASRANNQLSPTLTLDSGANTFWSANGGSLGVGIADKFTFDYKDTTVENDPAIGRDAKASNWKNVFTPYVRFTQVLDDALSVKAALDLPFSVEEGARLGFYDATVSPAASLASYVSDNDDDQKKAAAWPRLRVGAQYKFKGGKLALNAGVLVYLPALYYADATVTMENDASGNPTDVVDNVVGDYSWTWVTRDVLQELKLGASFKFTPNAMLDFWTKIDLTPGNYNLLENQITQTLLDWGGIVFSLTF
jgi:hypothetical protein